MVLTALVAVLRRSLICRDWDFFKQCDLHEWLYNSLFKLVSLAYTLQLLSAFKSLNFSLVIFVRTLESYLELTDITVVQMFL